MTGPLPIDPPGPILAIETTQRTGGVALRAADGRTHVARFEPQRRHDDRLMPAVAAAAEDLGVAPADLACICVCVGPGGFSGLRIGLATVQMLAWTSGASVVPVPAADVVAEGTPGLPAVGRVAICLAAKRDQAWIVVLDRRGPGEPWIAGASTSAGPEALATLVAGGPDRPPATAIVGDEHLPESFRAVATAAGVPVVAPVFDPAACLTAGLRFRAAGRTVAAADLRPIYPGPPEAVIRWRALHGPAGKA